MKKHQQDAAESTQPVDQYLQRIEADCLEDGPFVGRGGLTLRYRKFVHAYLGAACGNACKAYIMAGYSDANRHTVEREASRVLARPVVQAAIARRFSKHMLDEKWAKSQLATMANSSMANFLDASGDFDMNKAAALGAFEQIKEMEVITDPDTGKVVRRKIKLYDRLQAVVILLKVLGVLTDRVKIEDDVESKNQIHAAMKQVMTDPETREHARALADKLYPLTLRNSGTN